MGNSLFKLTSLDLNGVRSAASKRLEGWLAKTTPDCICLQAMPQERAGMTKLFEHASVVDVYRHLQPHATAANCTRWSNRARPGRRTSGGVWTIQVDTRA